MSYEDTKEREEILARLREPDNHAEELINLYYPNWIVWSTPHYSRDYEFLSENWKAICKQLKVEPQRIVLVDEIIFDDNHRIINAVAEEMTKRGYVVRRTSEFSFCKVCGGAIPVGEVWAHMKAKNLPIPRKWKETCRECA